MIWSIVSKKEMEGFGTSPVFRFYREALGKDNIQLAIVDEDDPLDFVKEDDIVLLRTASEEIINTIRKKGIKSTAEDYSAYKAANDKAALSARLASVGIVVPTQYTLDEVEKGRKYFVKPCFGSDSMGISKASICTSKAAVIKQVLKIKRELKDSALIEEFIDGVDCTIACARVGKEFLTCAIDVECDETEGIQTRECKVGFKEYCSPVYGEQLDEMREIASKIFVLLGIKHHARIDFRRGKDGKLYVIDINLLPGLGPLDHFAKCFTLSKRISYWEVMNMIVGTATKE